MTQPADIGEQAETEPSAPGDSNEVSESELEEQTATQEEEELNTDHSDEAELIVTLPDEKAAQAFQFLQSTVDCLYCWTLPDFNMVSNIQKIAKTSPACATLMSAMRPLLHCHCTAAFNPSEQYKQLANVLLNTQEGLECEQCLFVGPQGCAIQIRLSDTQRKLVNDDKDSFPHITVAVAPGCEPQQLGSMVAQCQALRGAAHASQTQTITHLCQELYMLSLSEHPSCRRLRCFSSP